MALDKLTQITTSGINSTTPLSGINVTGIITASSLSVSGITTGAAATFDSVDVLGVLTYDDVTNVDALGIVTARSGVRVTGGNVGIGTESPHAKLEVSGGQNQTANQFTDLVSIAANANNDALDAEVQLNFGISPSHTATANRKARIQSVTHAGDVTPLVINPAGGSIGIGTDNLSSKLQVHGTLGLSASDDPESSFTGGRTKLTSGASGFTINHNDNSSTIFQNQGNEKFRITSGGNVGIGTQIPAGRFQVGSNGSSNVIITENIGVDINDGAFNLYQATSNVNATPFILSTDVGGTEVEKVRINAAGNVGIGTALTGASSNTKLTLQTTDSSACRLVLSNSGSSTAESTQIWSQNDELAFNAGGSERLRVSAGGYVLKSNHPCFDAVRNSGHLSATTYINYNTVNVNNGGHYDSSNGRFTAPVAGYYFFSWGTIKNNDSATVARLHIHKNGVEAYNGRHLRMDSGQAYGDNGAMTVVIQLAKDDYIQIYLTAGSVYGVTQEYCFFNGYLLG